MLVLASWAPPPPLAQATNLDNTADRVFGQPDFAQNTANNGGLNANGMDTPSGVALDAQGNLYVADAANKATMMAWSRLALARRMVKLRRRTHLTSRM